MTLIWVHNDCLSTTNPAFRAFPNSPAVYVWDDAMLQSAAWSLKRIGFVYECLLEMPVTIRRGDPIAEVQRFAAEAGCERVVSVASPDPHLQNQAKALSAELLEPDQFVSLPGSVDLKRFSRYWSKAERALYGRSTRR